MDGRLAMKRPRETDKSTLNYNEWFAQNIYRQTQLSANVLSKKSCVNSEQKDAEMKSGKGRSEFTESLAEVYENALKNVLNIQPDFKMEENQNTTTEKKTLTALDTRLFQDSGGCKFLHSPHNDSKQQIISNEKTLIPKSKSAFHVPEKKRTSNNQPHYTNWSHDHSFPYPVNYPRNFYPVMYPPACYPRYEDLYAERFNYFPAPRRRDFPVFTHVLPWLQFERDFKPMTSAKHGDWCPKSTLGYEFRNNTNGDIAQHQLKSRPSSCEEKTADRKKNRNEGLENHESQGMCSNDKCNRSPFQTDLHNMKTRRMRAVEKKNDLKTLGKKDSFSSPKEEFLFSLGLAKVEAVMVGDQ